MYANYHTHTWRCNHAQGTEREYIERAIQTGIRVLGFADHSPYPFPKGHASGFRMRLDQLDDYCTTLQDLRREYAQDIEIHIGLEAEYYPTHFQALLDFVADYPIEYLLQGQHYTRDEYDGQYSGHETRDEHVLADYCKQVIEGQRTGHYLYLAHPDLIHYVGKPAIYEKHMRGMLRELKAMGRPIEFNILGYATHRHYPSRAFWHMAGEEGLSAVIGLDAHAPEQFDAAQALEDARKILKEEGVPLIEQLTLPEHC